MRYSWVILYSSIFPYDKYFVKNRSGLDFACDRLKRANSNMLLTSYKSKSFMILNKQMLIEGRTCVIGIFTFASFFHFSYFYLIILS